MANLVRDAAHDGGEPLPVDVTRTAAAAGLGAHQATWLPRHSWWLAPHLILPAVPAAHSITWLVTAGGKGPMWAVVLQLTGAALFCTVFLLLVRKIVDPRWRRVRVFGFAGGLVRRDKAGLLFSARWDEMTHAGWVTHRDGSPARTYTIDLREDRGWRLLVDDFQPGHLRALGEFVSGNRMTQRVRRPADEPAVRRPRRLAAQAQHLPQWARRI